MVHLVRDDGTWRHRAKECKCGSREADLAAGMMCGKNWR